MCVLMSAAHTQLRHLSKVVRRRCQVKNVCAVPAERVIAQLVTVHDEAATADNQRQAFRIHIS